MVKVSIEVRHKTGRFTVAIRAQSIQQAQRIIQARYPASVARVAFPIDPENFFGADSATPSPYSWVA
jgi:hypothetical protein